MKMGNISSIGIFRHYAIAKAESFFWFLTMGEILPFTTGMVSSDE